MDDKLIAELRALGVDYNRQWLNNVGGRAADEIERLRAEVEHKHKLFSQASADFDNSEAENERPRAALQRLADETAIVAAQDRVLALNNSALVFAVETLARPADAGSDNRWHKTNCYVGDSPATEPCRWCGQAWQEHAAFSSSCPSDTRSAE